MSRLEQEDDGVLLVSLADKLHNARATLADIRATQGGDFWSRFNAGRDEQEWYYRRLVAILDERLPSNLLATQLRSTVEELFLAEPALQTYVSAPCSAATQP